MSTPAEPRLRVAVIGGGICGAVAARELCQRPDVEVTLFDQGRRGPGGRASHRRVQVPAPNAVQYSASRSKTKSRSPLRANLDPIADDSPPPTGLGSCLEFDHGCQFFRCETARFATIVADWTVAGWVREWEGVFGGDGDFFGFPELPPFFVGVGGNHRLVRSMLSATPDRLTICPQTRVSNIDYHAPADQRSKENGTWKLSGVNGSAAFHDTAEKVAANALPDELGTFDAVLVTDPSASFGGWHRASANLPEGFGARVRSRVRVPLFACMVAFGKRLPVAVPDAMSFADGDVWFASRTRSKPGYDDGDSSATGGAAPHRSSEVDCWNLVSSPGFAVAEISAVEMQDPVTGAFRPQNEGYLKHGPCQALLRTFFAKLSEAYGVTAEYGVSQEIVYLQGQRWGSAFPAPVNCDGRDEDGASMATTTEVLNVFYEAGRPKLRLPPDDGEERGSNFVKDQRLIYYAGDYCSAHTPGVEASVLSALDAAAEITKALTARTATKR